MTKYLIVFFAVLLLVSCKKEVESTYMPTLTTFYLIRHAEKETGNDPLLTPKGTERAAYWNKYFDSIPLDLIYCSDTRRTLATVRAIAAQKKKPILNYDTKNLDKAEFLKEDVYTGKSILIVGHTNTTPAIINKLLGEHRYDDIADKQFGNLYTVSLKDSVATVKIDTLNNWDKE